MALTSASGTVARLRRRPRRVRAARRGSRRPCWRRPAEAAARRGGGGRGGSTPPTSSWSRSTRRAPRTSTRRSASPAAATGSGCTTRSPTSARSSRRAAPSTPRCASAARPSTCPTARCRCTRPCSPRARPACCRTARAPPCCGRSTSTRTGERTAVDVRRATVRSRARLDYAGVQADIDAGRPHPAVAALPELGALRRALAVARGRDRAGAARPGGGARRRGRLDHADPAAAARRGVERGDLAAHGHGGGGDHAGRGRRGAAHAARARAVGRRAAAAHGGDARRSPGRTARPPRRCSPACRTTPPPALALRRAASTLLRGAGYAAFDRAAGTAPPADPGHGGIGAPYAHVTAPLRRLVDRFGTEVCLAVAAGAALPEWLTAGAAHAAVGDGGVRRGGGQGGAGLRRPHRGRAAGRRGSERSSTRSCCGPPARRTSPVRCSSPSRPCWPAAPACRGRARWCGWSWSKRIRRPAESRSGRE